MSEQIITGVLRERLSFVRFPENPEIIVTGINQNRASRDGIKEAEGLEPIKLAPRNRHKRRAAAVTP